MQLQLIFFFAVEVEVAVDFAFAVEYEVSADFEVAVAVDIAVEVAFGVQVEAELLKMNLKLSSKFRVEFERFKFELLFHMLYSTKCIF